MNDKIMVRLLEDEDFLEYKLKETQDLCGVKFNGSGPFEKVSFIVRHWKQCEEEMEALERGE